MACDKYGSSDGGGVKWELTARCNEMHGAAPPRNAIGIIFADALRHSLCPRFQKFWSSNTNTALPRHLPQKHASRS